MEHLAVVACKGCGAGLPVRAGQSIAVCRFCGVSTPLAVAAVAAARQGGAVVEATLAAGLKALLDALTRAFSPNLGIALAVAIGCMALGVTLVLPIFSGAMKGMDELKIGMPVGGIIVLAYLPIFFAAWFSLLAVSGIYGKHFPLRRAEREVERLRSAFDLAPQPGNCPQCGGQVQVPGSAVTFDCVYCHTPLVAAAGMLVVWGEEAVRQAEGWAAEAKRIVKALDDRIRRMIVPYTVGGLVSSWTLFFASAYWAVEIAPAGIDALPLPLRLALPLVVEAALFVFLSHARRRGWLVIGTAPVPSIEDGLAAFGRGDFKTALRKLRPLAEQGDAQAQSRLGTMYFYGYGVEKDPVQAHVWLSLAAGGELQKADGTLDILTQQMTSEQLDEARKLAGEWKSADWGWIAQAAEQGDPYSQWKRGTAYYKGGKGVVRDLVQAHVWLSLAARDENYKRYGSKSLAGAEQQMTSEQLDEARRLAREWEPVQK